ncbi:MAG: hypothetical protein ACFFE8_03415 [Candidatus Heimdallarchaeota archaeon]
MVALPQDLKDSIPFEPMIEDLYGEHVNEQHARILAVMFKLGGYTTLNTLPGILKIKQPTVSIRVDELVKMGLIRKNTELMPMSIVLLLSPEALRRKNQDRIQKVRYASEFLLKISEVEEKTPSGELIQRALDILFPREKEVAAILARSYISPEELIEYHDSPDMVSAYIHLFTQKRKKPLIRFSRPALPLNLCVKSRLSYHEALHEYYDFLIDDLANYFLEEHVSVIPHQLLRFPSEIKNRIDTCLKHYQEIRIIDNNVFKSKDGKMGIVDLVVSSESFKKPSSSGDNHVVKVISQEKHKREFDGEKAFSFRYVQLVDEVSRDYTTRDFLIFGQHGCLVIPSRENIVAYYNITPSFTDTISEIFEKYWSSENA